GSGKTMLLQTMMTSLALDHSPAQVHIYVLDFGGRLLKLYEQLPHVGAVLLPDDEDLIARLFRMVSGTLDTHKTLLADAGIGSFAAYREHVGPENAPPATIVMIDNVNEFANAYPDLIDEVTRIAREGGNLGVHVVLTGSSAGSIPMRLASNFAIAAALELTDASDYGSVVGRTNGLTPERGVRGRGLIRDITPLEFQTCTPSVGQSDAERLHGVRTLIAEMTSAWDGPVAPPVRRVPSLLPLSDLLSPAPEWIANGAESLAAPIGVDVETLEPLVVDLRQDPHQIVTGSPLSGKTTLVQTWLVALAERYAPDSVQMVIVSMASPLFMPFSRLPHVTALVEDDDRLMEVAETLRVEMSNRHAALDAARRTSSGMLVDDEFIARYPTIVIAIDDFDQFLNLANEGSKEILTQLVRRGRRLGFRFIVASPSRDLSSSWDAVAKALKEAQTGVLLGSSDHEDLAHFNLRLPPAESGKSLPPGRGYVGKRGQLRRIQAASIHAGSPTLLAWIASIARKHTGAA
ncbi:MAG: hypothetical protein IT337_05655, partial [Thermomicrobiales bacterium]|nr:hypothetical protein [Thermomicrobiales bacterium]